MRPDEAGVLRTADLIGAVVVDSTGAEVGKVHDIRARLDGRDEVTAPYGVTHLLVAGGTVGTRLGYGYGHMRGPWPLSALLRRAMGAGYAVRWSEIASIERKRRVELSVPRDALTPASEVLGGAS